MRIHRFLSAVVALLLLGTLLAACGGAATPTTSAPTGQRRRAARGSEVGSLSLETLVGRAKETTGAREFMDALPFI